eukprot:scaffold3294_cov126-Skeletonema_dohrnii-CCMP3373.AAC.5
MTISQELFDETILENEECFDLPPLEALRETIDQFCQQLGHSPRQQQVVNGGDLPTTTIDDGDSNDVVMTLQSIPGDMAHLTLTHPSTPHGQVERENRRMFRNWLSLLDDCVGVDGVVTLPSPPSPTLTSLAADAGGADSEDVTIANTTAQMTANNDKIAEALDQLATKLQSNNHDALPYLIIFQQSSSIYTLMSFLTTIIQPTANDGTTNNNESAPTKEEVYKLQILRQTANTLISILTSSSKENVKCTALRGDIRDLFIVGLNRLVGLLFRLVVTTSVGDDGGDGAVSPKNLVLDLLKLSISAVRGCEGGKVAFVQSTIDDSFVKVAAKTLTLCNTKRGGVQVLYTILSNTTLKVGWEDDESATMNMMIIEATCQLLTTLCRYDDFRTPSTAGGAGGAAAAGGVSTSSAHDHAMEFHRVGVESLLVKVADGILNDLLLVDGEDNTDGDCHDDECLAKKELLAAAVLTALRVLAVNDEIIQTMVALGVLPIVTKALRLSVTTNDTTTTDEEESSTRSNLLRKHRLAAGSLGVIRNLCGNDEIKTNLCLGSSTDHQQVSISSTPSALPHLLRAMQLYPTISPIQEHACGTLAAMALRRPSNARAIIDEGGPRLILTAMKRHEENVSVQRQGALAVRNIVSRLMRDLDGSSGDNVASGNTTVEDARSAIRDRFGELGVEDVLRNIAGRHQGSVDEAYAALRDLGYSVTLTKFSAEDLEGGNNISNSNVVGRTMMFGEKHNSNFRPVYEQSTGLDNAVDEAVSNFGA